MLLFPISYIGTISDVYFFVIFVEINTNALSLCALIFCYLTVDWTNLYFVLVLTLTKTVLVLSAGHDGRDYGVCFAWFDYAMH